MEYRQLVKKLVENILRNPEGFAWQVQGLGMMRIYLPGDSRYRLHIWDSALKVPGVSAIHDHPWDLQSYVVAGVYRQFRFVETDQVASLCNFQKVSIKCGEGACTISEPDSVDLDSFSIETYDANSEPKWNGAKKGMFHYEQSKEEIHLSCPEDGTVTLVRRTFGEERDIARVYWRGRGPWVDAKPRAATPEEIREVTLRSLNAWF